MCCDANIHGRRWNLMDRGGRGLRWRRWLMAERRWHWQNDSCHLMIEIMEELCAGDEAGVAGNGGGDKYQWKYFGIKLIDLLKLHHQSIIYYQMNKIQIFIDSSFQIKVLQQLKREFLPIFLGRISLLSYISDIAGWSHCCCWREGCSCWRWEMSGSSRLHSARSINSSARILYSKASANGGYSRGSRGGGGAATLSICLEIVYKANSSDWKARAHSEWGLPRATV